MELLKSDRDRISVNLTRQDLVFINNILNEVCNGFPLANFSAQVGMGEEDAHKLLREIHNLAESIPRDEHN